MYPKWMRVKAVDLLLGKASHADVLAVAMARLENGESWKDLFARLGITQGSLGDGPANEDMQSLVAEVLIQRLGGAEKIGTLLADDRRRKFYAVEFLGIKLFPSLELTPEVRSWFLVVPDIHVAYRARRAASGAPPDDD